MAIKKKTVFLGLSFLGLALILGTFQGVKSSKYRTSANSEVVHSKDVAIASLNGAEQEVRTSQEELEKAPDQWPVSDFTGLPTGDYIAKLFDLRESKFPIVKTIKYRPGVSWIKGRSAWLGDYAGHYKTSKHFIARSLNKCPDYETQTLRPGDCFNVFDPEKPFEFYILVDMSRSHMWFYYIDLETGEKVFIKNYPVGLGRLNESRTSGSLTPIGKYSLGDRIGVYKPGKMGYFKSERREMVRIVGTRWIPFSKAISGASAPAKGYGIHGCAWKVNPETGKLEEDLSTIGKYSSDGCVRLAQEDMEELFSIVITKPTTIEIVHDFNDSALFKASSVNKIGDN